MSQLPAIFFPGQGSQTVGMLDALAAVYSVVRQTFEEASDALGKNLWHLVTQGSKEEIDHTENTQPVMLTAGVAVWRVWQAQSGQSAALMAGHSLGEYSALVAANALPFADAVRLAADRARFMQEAVPAGAGAMAALLNLTDQQVIALCAEQARGEVLAAVNFNAVGQVVIAGTTTAVNRALVAAKAAGARKAVLLPVSVPSHCALMRPAAARLAERLTAVPLKLPTIPVLHNVSVTAAISVNELHELLVQQLYSPVHWVDTVRTVTASGVTLALECGPGKVLTGLCKRIDDNLTTLPVFDPKTLDAALEAMAHVER
ncbi:[acyl-carrier-protein] S-malonyltransferase [Chromatium weissei]|nr:[acyl-carrier-protein] S-malonyltransferase [Chromatium weissei]